jgi:hypothetical protein
MFFSRNAIFFSCLGLLLSGCGSLINQEQQVVNVVTTCKNANYSSYCNASNESINLNIKTPAKLKITRTAQPLTIVCESNISGNYGAKVYPLPSAAFIGNIGIGGLLGMTVDAVNDKAFEYPTNINIEIPWCSNIKK